MSRRSARARGPVMLGSAALAAIVSAGTGVANADEAAPLPHGCPALVVVGVEGTGQSSPAADPYTDPGVLGSVFAPVAGDPADVQQIVVPYDAGFGGALGTGSGTATFAASSQQALQKVRNTMSAVGAQCPRSKIALSAYSQGAGVAARVAHEEGADQGPVPPDRIAGVLLMSDYTRAPGGQRFPGRPGQVSPDPVPGTSGASTSHVHLGPVPGSGGIASNSVDYGKLDGRVGQACAQGDLACDAPANAAALSVGAGIAAQTDFRSPATALASAGAAWSGTVSAVTTRVLLDDVHLDSGRVDYTPQRTVSDRLAQAAVNPDAPPTREQSQAAAVKAQQVAAAVAADPLGQIPRLAQQIAAAVVPNLAANAALTDPTTVARYANTITQHDSYGTNPPYTAWLSAMTRDLHGGQR